jgi:HEAT repeat protein
MTLKGPRTPISNAPDRPLSELGSQVLANLLPKYLHPDTSDDERDKILEIVAGLKPANIIPFHLSVFVSNDFELVKRSSLALGYLRSKSATRPLLKILRNSPSWQSRMFAAATLMELRDKRAVLPLIAVAENVAEDERVRDEAAEALSVFVRKQPDRVIPALLRLIDDGSAWVRWSVAFSLGHASDARVVPALERLSRDETILPGGQVCIGADAIEALSHVRQRLERRKRPAKRLLG